MTPSLEPVDADMVVVGGGIVGLAVAWAARQRFPTRTIMVLEQEAELAHHQSGRNSGVLHSGLYYRPGSAKAELAVRGQRAMVDFAVEHGVAHRIGGKVVRRPNGSGRPTSPSTSPMPSARPGCSCRQPE